MSIRFETYILIALFLLYVDILIILKVTVNSLKVTNRRERFLKDNQKFINGLSEKSEFKKVKRFSKTYNQMRESVFLDDVATQEVEGLLNNNKSESKNIKKLASCFQVKRMEGATGLGLISSDKARIALERAIKKEKDTSVKLYMANALSDIGNCNSIPVLISTLINAHHWYRNRANILLVNFGEGFENYLPELINRPEAEIKELITEFASANFSQQSKDYLIRILEEENIDYSHSKYKKMDEVNRCCGNCIYGRKSDCNGDRVCTYKGAVDLYHKCWRFQRLPISIGGTRSRQELVYKAAEILATYYPKVLENEKYLNNGDINLKNIAVKALSKGVPFESIEKLIALLSDHEVARTSMKCILEIIDNNPGLIQKVISEFENENNSQVKAHLGEILSQKIEYFIMKLMTQDKKTAREVIEQGLLVGRATEIIDFMNTNKNTNIENELILIITKIISKDQNALRIELSQYLNERILEKCGLAKYVDVAEKRIQVKDKNVTRLIYCSVIFVLLFFPIVYIIRHWGSVLSLSYGRQIRSYVVDFNYYIAFYAMTINLIYLVLMVLSVINVRRQSKRWELKASSLLFKERMLPGISIIAPAYNEEKTIVESVNSLLNLVYPDYELIIVNDGSADQTLSVLIGTFDLKRIESKNNSKLETKHVRGVYMCKSRPKLVVIDKVNGGKADSLNVGINQSRKEYFCGIDADSILEPEALLKLASRVLDTDVETPALGGNVLPANGCTIEKGSIANKAFPKNTLARLQTIEYIRAFMAGRLGWAFSNCLLIISGAFGLFRKERVIDVGGYLTVSGKHGKDTVGEDMELVVRIGRMMREKGLKYKIDYVYNANCWTEVPEDLKSMRTQRYRWHRGLVDILTFHRKMLFNPAYGRAGLVAMPYFFIFEFIGPFIEIQGYLMILLSVILGLMNLEIAMLLFISTILLGVLISLYSVLIAQEGLEHLRPKDISILIFYAVAENFGPRQMISIWRFRATLRLLWRQDGWGKAKRKGFRTTKVRVEG